MTPGIRVRGSARTGAGERRGWVGGETFEQLRSTGPKENTLSWFWQSFLDHVRQTEALFNPVPNWEISISRFRISSLINNPIFATIYFSDCSHFLEASVHPLLPLKSLSLIDFEGRRWVGTTQYIGLKFVVVSVSLNMCLEKERSPIFVVYAKHFSVKYNRLIKTDGTCLWR